MKITTAVVSVFFLLMASSIHAAGLDDLKRFYSEIQSYSASFEQVVVDENMKLLEASNGEFSIERPGKFYWHYITPSEQMIIGDGKQVWIYDVELEQITHRQADAAVSQTPAMLLSGEGDLDDSFILEEAGRDNGLDWVRMIPKNRDSGFIDVRIGFASGKLQRLEMKDNFGQSTRMSFKNVKENIDIPGKVFNFIPPSGVDVIEEAG